MDQTHEPSWTSPVRPSLAELLTVAIISLIVLLGLYTLVTQRVGLAKDDARQYALMAEDPTYLPRVPYTFRVLTPLLVRALPLDTTSSFTVVTIAGLWLSGLFLYAFTRALGLGVWPSRAAIAMLLGSGLATRALTTPLYVDALTYLTEIAGFYFLLNRRASLFGLTLLLGTLNRETALFLAPVYLLEQRAEGRLTGRDFPRVLLVLGPAVIALAAVVAIKLVVGGALESGLGVLETKPRTFEQNLPSWQDLADVYTVFGAAWLLAALNLRAAPAIVRRGWPFGLLVILQLGVSRGDESRNLSHLLALVLPLAALEFRGRGALGAAALLIGTLASQVNFRWVILPLAAVRYGLVAFGSLLALVLAGRRRTAAPFDRLFRPRVSRILSRLYGRHAGRGL